MSRRLLGYAIAVGSTAFAVGAALPLQASFGRTFLSMFSIAIMLSAWYGGLGPALFASVLSALSINYFLQEPRFTLQIASLRDVIQLAVFLAAALLMSLLVRTRDRAREEVGAVARRASDNEALAELVRRGAAEPTTPRVVELICEQAAKLCGADYAGVRLVDETGRSEWRGMWGNQTDAWKRPRASTFHGGATEAMDTGRTVVSRTDEMQRLAGTDNPHSVRVNEGGVVQLATPLSYRGSVQGALVVGWRREVSPSDEVVRVAEIVSGYAGVVLNNAQSRAEIEQRKVEAEALAALVRDGAAEHDPRRAIALVCDRGRELAGADYATVTLVGDDNHRLRQGASGTQSTVMATSRGRGQGPTSQVLAAKRALIFERVDEHDLSKFHTQEDGKTALAAPILGRDGLQGAVHFGWRSHVTLAPSQARLAEALAGYSAVILENAQAHAKLEQRAADLAASEAQLRTLHNELEHRVVERTAELQAANAELESFSYSVSHDLQAPLRGINGFSQVLLETDGANLSEEGRGYLERVRAASQRMAALIDGLLGLARLARTPMDREQVDLSAMARSIMERLRESDPGRVVTCVIEADIAARGDAILLRSVLENLLGNSWKFSAKQPLARIEFGATEVEGERAFFVRDDGSGFEMAYKDKLFRPFQRLHGMTEFEGTGIGLATVYRIVRRHGGRVWAEGDVDRGATFYFTLTEEARPPVDARDEAQAVGVSAS